MGRERILVVFILTILLGGCASQIMKSYIGKDVREAVLDYGPPVNAMDMGDGVRAFQWSKHTQFTTPIYAKTNSNITGIGRNAWVSSNTTISGGETVVGTCLYTIFARWDDRTSGWVVTGFKKPNFICE